METKCSSSTCCASEGLGLRRWARYRGYARRARWGCARFALAAVPLAGLRGCGLELGWGAGAVRGGRLGLCEQAGRGCSSELGIAVRASLATRCWGCVIGAVAGQWRWGQEGCERDG
ncbi:hypothetical protein ACOSQ3_004128 [Xanthoceras sorbifolium]